MTTHVVNSRSNKKVARIWRRRKCNQCQAIFTTEEYPRLDENQKIFNSQKQLAEPFNLSQLIISIYKSFTHNPRLGAHHALSLAQSVQYLLMTEHAATGASSDDISAITHEVLRRYDEVAAVQYAAKHGMITMKRRRRGRPSVSLP